MPQQNATYLNYAGFQCLEDLNHSTIDLYLSTCGIQNCNGGHFFGPGMRDSYILHFISDGKGIFTSNGNTYHLGMGDVFLVKPEEEIFYQADEKTPWSYMWVGFQGIKAAVYLAQAGLQGERVTCRCENIPFIFSCIQQMIMSRHLTQANELKREAALLQILAALIEEYKSTLPKEERYDYPHQIYVEQAVDYIKKNMKKNIKVNDIASYIGIDRSYLTNVFKSATGLSPQEYIVRCRMEQAEILLKGTQVKISDVACAVGYTDALSFSKMFKKYKGMSPMEFRISHLD
jgi:AraC family transcriptional regulator of arabinose operon